GEAMLSVFRKYQKFLYGVVTFFVVLSFSFFGTFDTLGVVSPREQVAFVAIDGQKVLTSEVEDLALLISADFNERWTPQGRRGVNFLTEEVIVADFLASGLAEQLIHTFPEVFRKDLEQKHKREKTYRPYVHPGTDQINAEMIWSQYRPEMIVGLKQLQEMDDVLSEEGVQQRIALYLEQRRFPPVYLAQMVRRLENFREDVERDPALVQGDYSRFSLFHYQNLDDWFGPNFSRLASQVVINLSILAEQKGYRVTAQEALSDLLRQNEQSYLFASQYGGSPMGSAQVHFKEQLRRMGIGQGEAVELWRKVLLFRRMVYDIGSAVFLSPGMLAGFNAFAEESIEVENYALPNELHLNSFRQLQKFETYLAAVTKKKGREALSLPEAIESAQEVQKRTPELVEKVFAVEMASVTLAQLQQRISVKETWEWQQDSKNWQLIRENFPEWEEKKEKRIDPKTQAQLDHFSRTKIVEAHPEWVEEMLSQQPMRRKTLTLPLKGGELPFEGIRERADLIEKLTKLPEGDVLDYTEDNKHFYRFKKVSDEVTERVMPFTVAESQGVLDQLLEKKLQTQYITLRQENPERFQREDQSWRPFKEVVDIVAKQAFAPLLTAIENEYRRQHPDQRKAWDSDQLASLRFYRVMREAKEKLEKGESLSEGYWNIQKRTERLTRKGSEAKRFDQLHQQSVGSWSGIETPDSGDLHFVHLVSFSSEVSPNDISNQLLHSQQALGNAALKQWFQGTMTELIDKKALKIGEI
ncbi:MAG: hypothetical protein KDK65_03505, partial [Chlamydiia bacterium]|nr:hypothetical protein [Chlamydiia bacterium]